jgi:hypothetical protein
MVFFLLTMRSAVIRVVLLGIIAELFFAKKSQGVGGQPIIR